MKTITLISTLVCCWGVTAGAQGVHLSSGDSLAIGFNGIDPNGCFFDTEGLTQNSVLVAFGLDGLGLGESMRLELFENNLNDSPFALQTYSPAVSTVFAILPGGDSRWSDRQGLVRVTMLNGSVDIDYARFTYAPNRQMGCPVVISVPEPSTFLLMSVAGIIGGAIYYFRRERQ